MSPDLAEIIVKYCGNKKCELLVYVFESPLGRIVSAADDEFLYLVAFEDSKNLDKMFGVLSKELSCSFVKGKNDILILLEEQLRAYFEGELKEFTVPLKTTGSDFQKEVWGNLLKMSYGSTQSYGDLAKSMGRPSSHARAVGAACGANAHIIIIPCHRLVGSNNKGGFSSGIDRKDWLMGHEKKYGHKLC